MKSYIDLSGCSPEIVERHKTLLRLPIRLGKHEKDFDFVMEELTDKERERIEAETDRKYKKAHGSTYWLDKSLPVGTNLENLPKGSVLHLEI